ncbi:MAG: tyrosine-type recombinase/integrase [Planctomycetes bacterium]|nr:tyrosine-type recombinase/integrase [Planctomycetota bacterium]
MRRWDLLVDRYLEEYEAAGRSLETRAAIRRELGRCGWWLKGRRPRPRLEDVGSDLLIEYLQHRGAFRSKSTLAAVMSQLRCWGEFLVREGVWSSNPLRWLRGPKLDSRSRVPRRISEQVLQAVLQTAATSRYGYHRWAWMTLLVVFYGTGARRGEVSRLDLSDWDREEGLLLIDGRKTGRERRVPVADLVRRCLEGYLPQRHNLLESVGRIEEPALFVSKNGTRLSPHAISHGMQSLAKRSGHEQVTLHQFRHSCASDLLENGVHIAEVQKVLGHQRIETTVRYLHVADPQLHASVARHPINAMLSTATEGGC